jgi:hypothetical protein
MGTQTEPLPTTYYGEVMFVEYDGDGHPFNVLTRAPRKDGGGFSCDQWDFDWSKHMGCSYFHKSGGGQTVVTLHGVEGVISRIWAADSMSLVDPKGRPITYRRALELGYERLPAPLGDPFEDAHEGQCECCAICNDWLPDDSLCAHLFEDARTGEIVGPGNEDSVRHAKDEVLAAVRRLGCARTLRRALTKGHEVWNDGVLGVTVGPSWVRGRSFPAEIERDTSAEVGLQWLCALSKKTSTANAAVLAWLDELIAEQDARRASEERCYVVCENRYVHRPRRTELLSWAEARAYLARRAGSAHASGGRWITRVVTRPKKTSRRTS